MSETWLCGSQGGWEEDQHLGWRERCCRGADGESREGRRPGRQRVRFSDQSEDGTWEAESSIRVRVAFPRPGADEEDGWQRDDRPRRRSFTFRWLLPHVGHRSGVDGS